MRKSRIRISITGLIAIISALLLVSVLCYAVNVFLFQFPDETKPRVFQTYLSDLDTDGDLDAFLVYLNELNRILHNDGSGHFSVAERLTMHSYAMALEDIDGDGELEAIISNFEGSETGLLCAETPKGFALKTQSVIGSSPYLATRNGDVGGAPGAFLAGCCNGTTFIYNYGTFSSPSPCLSPERTNAVALVDLNSDSAPDAFLAKGRVYDDSGRVHSRTPNEVWINDGHGSFNDSGQRLGRAESLAVVVGDINRDGFPDAVVANRGPDEVWLNDGMGNFSSTGQRIGKSLTRSLFLVDLDGDGDPDLFAAGDSSGLVWLNDGDGRFQAGQSIDYGRDKAIALGDLTGQSVIDVFVADVDSYQIWHGMGDGTFTPDGPVAYQDGP